MNWRDNHDDPPEDTPNLIVIAALIVLFLFVIAPRVMEVWP